MFLPVDRLRNKHYKTFIVRCVLSFVSIKAKEGWVTYFVQVFTLIIKAHCI